ncbi:BscS [Chania multitudinisentens RB-25]|uniref:BscS n=1 Tax=Chania multitudinisentens RB-25 TaxID=1441930 RepID=W0LHH1_9GAMM|nr:cellulose biosynthesis protein BcsC [Chania multitudinisentens]AHG21772.1 BscS [Chania multitudinisentens RB-25]
MEYSQLNILLKKQLYGVSLAGLAVFSLSAIADDSNPALKALFEQAAYWHDKSHDDLAQGALQKVLLMDENNTEAMYLLSLYAMQSGDKAKAEQWRKKLSEVAPQDPRLQALDSNNKAQSPAAKNLLAQARQYAAKGNFPQAIASYQAIFNGKTPIDNLANEYYLTLAGTPTGRQEAIDGLKQRLALQPNDTQTRVVLGKVMTYQESTRREGINLLASLAPTNNDADQGLKQALLWLAPQPTDKPLYDAYQQRHPADKAVAAYYQQNIAGAAKSAGFTELNKGDLTSAKSQFESILASNPNDKEALAGMGFTAMRSGDFSQAEDYLNQAAKQGGPQSAQWSALAQDANLYGALAKGKQAVSAGKLDEALALTAPLTNATGDKGSAVMLFRADVLRRQGDFTAAEQVYRGLLAQNPQNNDAKLGLYYLLLQQRKGQEAELVLQSLPANLRPKINQTAAGVNVDPLRKEAALAVQQNNPQRAMMILQQALEKQPSNAWVRLDMARILSKQGQELQAQTLISPLMQVGAPADSVYAAALFASERNDWLNVSTLMARIPASRKSRDMRELAATASVNQQRVSAENYLRQGNTASAAAILRQMAQKPPTEPAALGELAKDLMAVGDTATAVQLVRENMRQGVKGNAGDYSAQIAVLNQAGLSQEADAWLNNPALLAKSSAREISQLRNGGVINEADTLRLRGQYGAAYDKLIAALQDDPQNADIMLAMGRLYQSGNMNQEAGQVFNYLLNRDSLNQGAREGAIGIALAEGEVGRAKQLLGGLPVVKTPDQLLLAARVAEADGNYPHALSLLREAKSRLNGVNVASGNGQALIGGLRLADNPFATQTSTLSDGGSASPSAYGQVLPWQVAAPGLAGSYANGAPRLPGTLAKNPTLQQVEKLMDEVQNKTATWVQGNISLRNNSSGESGLSNITEIRSPISVSGMPVDDGRVTFEMTPVMLKSGTPSSSANSRFGTGALQQARAVEAATQASVVASQNSIAAARDADLRYQEIHATRDHLCSLDPTSADCDAATLAQAEAYDEKQRLDGLITQPQTFNPNDFYADSPGQQQENGVELALALSGDSYKLDVGSTPLGSGISSVVGGLKWAPKVNEHTTLDMRLERRAVTDSLLSYVGTEDVITGKKWGAVTKNGGSLNLGFDDGAVGAYGGAGYYSYVGDNVARNKSINALVGAYIRPYKDDENEVKLGVNVSYMDFDKNLSYFSYGQGGYFSPQDYISISLPVEFTKKYDNFTYTLGGNVGYQSYHNQESAYFPNDPNLQSQLEGLVNQGYGKEAMYAAEDKSGIGYSLKANGNYKIAPNMLVGGQLGYDTFGSYSESSALLYFKYLLDGK